jgi:acyl-[acyl-carrier-protein] desaturase
VLIDELTDTAELLLNNHNKKPSAWEPSDLIPYELGLNYKTKLWTPDDYTLSDGIRSSIYVNLLTEDNLPYYSPTIIHYLRYSSPLLEWGHVWTEEEAKHSVVIREWAHVTRALDPVMLEQGRKVQMRKADVPNPQSLADLLAYTSFQELATRVAHANTGRALDSERGGKLLMATVAGDEAKHHIFYSELAKKAMEIEPSATVIAVRNQLVNFVMPGKGIPDFIRHSLKIERARIYDTPKYLHEVVIPTLGRWSINDLEGLDEGGEKARDEINEHVLKLMAKVALIEEKRQRQDAQTTNF